MKHLARTLACFAVCMAAPVTAQSYFPNIQVSDFPDPVVSSSDDSSPARPSSNKPVYSPAPVSSASLNFRFSKAVRDRNIARMVAEQRKIDPAGAAQTEALFSSTDVLTKLDQMMRPLGLRANNVADAYTVWWIEAWEAVHNRSMGDDRALHQAVKQQAEAMLVNTPQLASASDEVKQEFAESLLIHAMLIDGAMENARGNQSQLAKVAQATNKGAKTMGLDLTKLDLTSEGFVKRSGGRSDAGGDNSQLAANDGAEAGNASMGDYALYAVAGTGLLAGMFALGKGFSKKG